MGPFRGVPQLQIPAPATGDPIGQKPGQPIFPGIFELCRRRSVPYSQRLPVGQDLGSDRPDLGVEVPGIDPSLEMQLPRCSDPPIVPGVELRAPSAGPSSEQSVSLLQNPSKLTDNDKVGRTEPDNPPIEEPPALVRPTP